MRRYFAFFLILSLLLMPLSSCAVSGTSPAPAAASSAAASPDASSAASVCTLIIRCDTLLGHMQELDPDKIELVPSDGLIYENDSAAFTPGESVFDVLSRELQSAKIHLEFSRVPAYDTVYIEGIANLYEFDCGELSGWTYRVNGEFLSMGCSECPLESGDVVEFLYTCDLGADVGNAYSG